MSPPLARRLRRAAVRHSRQARHQAPGADDARLRLSIADLMRLHGEATVPALLMTIALISVMPIAGAGSLFSIGLLGLGWTWALGRERFDLHPRLGSVSMNVRWSGRSLHALAWVYGRATRWLRPRWHAWSHEHTRGFWGAWIALMAVIIFIPLPLGNVLPSLSLILLGLGWMFRDGLALLVATTAGAGALAYTLAFGQVAIDLIQRGWHWFTG